MTDDPLLAEASPAAAALIRRIAAADGSRDLDVFMAILTDDARLRIGSLPWADKPRARLLIGGLFISVRAIQHRLVAAPFERNGALVYVAEVTFTRRDGRAVTLPYVNMLEPVGDQVGRYDIHMDASATWDARAEQAAWMRMAQRGVFLTDRISVAAKIQADWKKGAHTADPCFELFEEHNAAFEGVGQTITAKGGKPTGPPNLLERKDDDATSAARHAARSSATAGRRSQ